MRCNALLDLKSTEFKEERNILELYEKYINSIDLKALPMDQLLLAINAKLSVEIAEKLLALTEVENVYKRLNKNI